MTVFAIALASGIAERPAVLFRPARFRIDPTRVTAGVSGVGLNAQYAVDLGSLIDKRLNRLRASEAMVTPNGQPTAKFQQEYQANVEQTEQAIRSLARGQIDLRGIVAILLATQKAAGEATVAAAAAQEQANRTDDYNRVRDSYSDAGVLSASNAAGVATITVAAHQRHYLDPPSDVALTGGSIGGLPAATQIFVFYEDPELDGGAITYQATPDETASIATLSNPFRHRVGTIMTPTNTGEGTEGGSSVPPWRAGQERTDLP